MATTKTAGKKNTGKGKKAPAKGGKGIRKPSPMGFRIERTDAGLGEKARYHVSHPAVKGDAIRYTRFIKVMGATGWNWPMVRLLLVDAGMDMPSKNTVRSQLHSAHKAAKLMKTMPKNKLAKLLEGMGEKGNPLHHGVAGTDDTKRFSAVLSKAKTYYAERVEKARDAARAAGI